MSTNKPHMSDAVRADLDKLGGEKKRRLLDAADRHGPAHKQQPRTMPKHKEGKADT